MSLAPTWVNPYRSIALKIYGENSKDTAMEYMRKAISVNPRDGSTYILIGDLLRYYLENADSSLYYYRLALTMTPKSAHSEIYRKMGARFFRAYGNLFTVKLDSIAWYSQKALSIDSNNIGAYLNLARLYERLKKPDSALLYYLKIISIAPHYQSPYVSINRYYAGRNMSDSVFFYSKKLLHADPKNSYGSLVIGDYYEKKGANRDSAILYYQRSVNSNYSNDMSYERLGYLLMDKDKKDTTALNYFTYLLSKSPLQWRQYYNIACYYSNHGNTDKAVEFLEKAFARKFRNYKQINEDRYLDPIRNSEGFKKLMAKYFPK